MAKFQPELETRPICGSTCNCHIHDYYGHSIINFQASKREKSTLCVMRVFCDSCGHAHVVLPNIIIPYSSYSLLFILRLSEQHFADRFTIGQLCERYEISQNQFYKRLALWKSHKQEWLGILTGQEASDFSFLKRIVLMDSASSFSFNPFDKQQLKEKDHFISRDFTKMTSRLRCS